MIKVQQNSTLHKVAVAPFLPFKGFNFKKIKYYGKKDERWRLTHFHDV